jgi:hypothetical protein
MSPAETTISFSLLTSALVYEFWQLLFSHAGNLQAAQSDAWWHSNMLPPGTAIYIIAILNIHAILLLK